MKTHPNSSAIFALCAMATAGLLLAPVSHAQTADAPVVVASLNFNPKVDGYGFENYDNKTRDATKDLGVADMIKLFGAKAVLKSGTDATDGVLKASASGWLQAQLKSMNKGHCEGMAATALRFKSRLPFNERADAASYQPDAKSPFDLKLDSALANYIAYYFATQAVSDVGRATGASAKQGPLAVVQTLIDSMKAGTDTFTLGIYKYNTAENRSFDGHAITPIAVEDAGDSFRIHVYDNNYPGETRYVVVNKSGKQAWKYVTSTNPNEPPAEYTGDTDTKTLELTSTALRDKGGFDAPFADASDEAPRTTIDDAGGVKNALAPQGDQAEFFLDGPGDLLVTTAGGKRLGFDPRDGRFHDEIGGGRADLISGGLGGDMPNYFVPASETGEPDTITFSGQHLTQESTTDFVYSAPGFTVGFKHIQLDPNETLSATISPDGQHISFTASADGQTPEISFAFDPKDDTGASYTAQVGGVKLDAGKTLSADMDFEGGTLAFKDNDGHRDKYDIQLTRLNEDGTEQKYEKKDFEMNGPTDNYQMDFKNWDGKGAMGIKEDLNGNGFADDTAKPQVGDEAAPEADGAAPKADGDAAPEAGDGDAAPKAGDGAAPEAADPA